MPDYGIDGEVEVFDSSGKGTGLRFLVQLKATDNATLERALKIPFRIDTFNYYHALLTPILIVRYQVPNDRVFAKWFHQFDPYHGRRGTKTVTFAMSSADEWTSSTPDRLLSDLKAIRQLRLHNLPLPLTVRLIIEEDQVFGLWASEIRSEISLAAERLRGILSISGNDAEESSAAIRVGSKECRAALSEVNSCTLHPEESYSPDCARIALASDLFLALSIALDCAGYPELSAQIISEFGPNSTLILIPKVALQLADCMARAQRITEALAISEKLLTDGATSACWQVFAVTVLAKRGLSESEGAFVTLFWERVIAKIQESGEPRSEATAHYNLGNHLMSRKFYRRAFREYRKAAHLDPTYLQRDYYCNELGGVLFLMKRYRFSERLYARALELGQTGLIEAVHADALMHAGRYGEALSAFDQYLTKTESPASEWKLKRWLLRGLKSFLNVETQQRDTRAAKELALSVNKRTAISRLEDALKQDSLCNPAWFNLAIRENQKGDQIEAGKLFLIAALCDTDDIEAWSNATILSLTNLQLNHLFPDTIAAAYFIHKELFVKSVNERLNHALTTAPESARAAVQEAVSHAIREFVVPTSEQPFTARWLAQDGSGYDEIVIPKGGK